MPEEQFKGKIEALPDTFGDNFVCATATLDEYSCDICSYSTHFKILLAEHRHNLSQKSSKTPQSYFCDKCNSFESNSVLLLLKHEITCKTLKNEPTKCWYKCGHCPFEAKLRRDVKRHFKSSHFSEDIWCQCQLCGHKVRRRYKMKAHTVAYHTLSTEIQWFKCDLCSYKGKLRQHMQRHVKIRHAKDRKFPYKCELCPYKSQFITNLRRHWNHVHASSEEVKWFQCDYCDFKAKSDSNLIKHVKNRHTDPSLIEWARCELCSFKSKQKQHLRTHIFWKQGAE